MKKIAWTGLAVVLAGVAWTGIANLYIIKSTQSRVYDKLADVPPRDVALVLGAQGPHLARRLQAAAELYHAGKARHLLVSGDNHIKSYDEPSEMKAGLIRLGVPAGAITCDFAGFRTLDSVIRARKIFGQDKLIIVTQRFHTWRALASARRYGIDAVAFCAEDVPPQWRSFPKRREVAARAVAVLDLYILHRGPKFLGSKEPIKLE
jgi:SanA protein